MVAELIDRYLLGEPVSKSDVVGALLAERSANPAAEPFYRAFEAVGTRAADEALIALRLVLSGRLAEDEAVRRLRALTALSRATAMGDRAGVAAAFRRERACLADLLELPEWAAEGAALGATVRAAYFRELGL